MFKKMRVATREEESLTIMTKHSTDKIIMDNYDVCVAQTLVGSSSGKRSFGMCRGNGTA
jgi:hypothetical protein